MNQKGKCPECLSLLVTTGKPHCQGFLCGWVKCKCQAVIDISRGRSYSTRGK
jgi:hypothetical protein